MKKVVKSKGTKKAKKLLEEVISHDQENREEDKLPVLFENCAAQGDLLIKRIPRIPDNCKECAPINGRHIVAHSETGHHHAFDVMELDIPIPCLIDETIEETKKQALPFNIEEALESTKVPNVRFFKSDNPNVSYVTVNGKYADLVHHRSFDTHRTLRFPAGTFELRRQVEKVPEGWRQVMD